jgi:DNA-binding CsgD family transcriptional regulator
MQARGISHQYDEPVALEGIQSIVAVPMLVSGRVAGVLYAALRQRLGIGERMQRLAMTIAWEAERRLTTASRLAGLERGEPRGARPGRPDTRLSGVCAELASIIGRVDDPDIRAELELVRARLAAESPGDPDLSVLSERELEALCHAASGLANAQIARRMGLAPGTVKAYLGSVMRKLDCHNRMAAVNAARALGYSL